MRHGIRTSAVSALTRAVVAVSAALFGATAQAQFSGGTSVSFTSHEASGAPVALHGYLWTPAGTPKGAVVLVHGSGGWSDAREGHYGHALSNSGYAALAIDAFGARGIRETTEDQAQISATQMTRDAFAARRLLVERGFAPDRIAVMGFSKGGTVSLRAADRNWLPEETDRFAVAIPFYPGCNVRPRAPKPASRVFMALGDKDDYSGVAPCQEIAAGYRNAGGDITVKIYPGAAHAFDGHPRNTGLRYLSTVENFMNCMTVLEEDGRISYQGKRYDGNDPNLMKDLRSTCARKGASVWTNLRQKEAATQDVIQFLGMAFDARQ